MPDELRPGDAIVMEGDSILRGNYGVAIAGTFNNCYAAVLIDHGKQGVCLIRGDGPVRRWSPDDGFGLRAEE